MLSTCGLVFFAINKVEVSLHITTYYAQYIKCAAAHLIYLHTTPQLLADIANRCEDYVKGAIS